MKKKNILLALLLAGVMSVGAFAATGCKEKDVGGTDDNQGTVGDNNQGTSGGNNQGTSGDNNQGNSGGNNQGTSGDNNQGNSGDNNQGNSGDNNQQTPGGETGGEEDEPVVLSEDTAISLTVGESKSISAADGASFNSDDATVATVNSSGVVTAKTAGVAKVTATTAGSVVTCTVIVLKKVEGSQSAPVKDAFAFSGSKDIGAVTETAPVEPTQTNSDEYVVTFSDGALSQNVEKGLFAVEPVGVEKDGFYLTGWKEGSAYYDFNSAVNSNLSLTAQWNALPSGINLVQGNQESIAVEFTGASTTAVQYKLDGGEWKNVDAPLVRDIGGGSSRVDILGLTPGVYTVKVGTKEISDIRVKAYDRSGYAHFNYTDGVGAYKDDGTIKDNVIVIYLTEQNKNDILNDCYLNGQKIDITQYVTDSSGVVHRGVGEIFNNRRYAGNDRANVGIQKLTDTFGGVALRVIGTVDNNFSGGICTITGLTDFNSTGNGGTVGDSGGMARMVNAKNVTLEGVGTDATLDGWGFHLVSSYNGKTAGDTTGTKADPTRGKSFEARNLIFQHYPEDALGMEGEQGTGTYNSKDGKMNGASSTASPIISPVERCWVHNNTFHQGGGKGSAAEGDKNEGDGSCDFKRGRYFTFSYNYLDWCHKTNLQGSSDSSLQFDISMHHNWWVNCSARMPLVRNSNVHFYNNYVFADMTDDPKPSLSQISSVRANAYLFTESNYYDGCKGVVECTSGGVAKAYANSYNSCFNGDASVLVTGRETPVSNNCKYTAASIDYSTFDTNPSIFYYDATAKKTKGLVDGSVAARWRAIQYAGALGHGEEFKDNLLMNTHTPKQTATTGSIDTSKITAGSVTNGVYSNNLAKTKGKGQLVTFSLAAPTLINITTTTSGEPAPQLVRDDGKIILNKFTGTESVELSAGTYFICTGQKDKESAITALSFEEAAGASEVRVNNAKAAISAIPQKISLNSKTVIEAATKAYNALTASEKEAFDTELLTKYQKALTAYNEVSTEYVIARIDYIGTVTEYSGNDINAAQKAYSALSATLQAKVTNYSKLTQAQETFAQFAATNVSNYINTLPANTLFAKITDSVPAINLMLDLLDRAVSEYDSLDEDAQEAVTAITTVKSDINTLKAALKVAEKAEAERKAVEDFKAALATVDKDNIPVDVARQIIKLYNAMPAESKTEYATNATFVAVKQVIDAQPKGMVLVFNAADNKTLTDNGVTVTGAGGYKEAVAFTVDSDGDGTDETYNTSLSIGSGTITFTVDAKSKITVYITADGKSSANIASSKGIKLNGTKYCAEDGNNVVVENVEAGTVTVQKGDSCRICYIIVEPAQ